MPSKRKPRSRHPVAGLTDFERSVLIDEPDARWEWLPERRTVRLWQEHRDWAVKEHDRRWPGHRPYLWWKHESPEPRRRLRGVGDYLGPPSECYVEQRGAWRYGIPCTWLSESWARMLNGELPHGPASKPGRRRIAVDWSEPPVFESEPVYLKRLHLELPGELERMDPTELEDAIEL